MIKWTFLLVISFACSASLGQNFQLHYDFRHSLDPGTFPRNYPSLSVEIFKPLDTIGTGSFLAKVQTDLNGKNGNTGQVFLQLSQSIRFWKPPVYLYAHFSGGLGVAPGSFGYYIANAFGAGLSYPFQWKGAFLTANLSFRYNAFVKPSYDPQFTLYFGRGISHYRYFISGSFVFWTENRDHGDVAGVGRAGKKFAFFGDPQLWWNCWHRFSTGTRLNVFYHTLTDENQLQLYPTLGLKYQF